MEPNANQSHISKDEKTSKTMYAPSLINEAQLPTSEHRSQIGGTWLEGIGGKWKSLEKKLIAYNLESRGIQRVEPDERQDLRFLGYSQVAIMWFSVNLAANNITLGMLGPAIFALGFLDSCLLSVFGAFLGCLVVAYVATFGPKSGNRTRY